MSRRARQRRAPSQVPEHASLKPYGRVLAASQHYVRAVLSGFGVDAVDIDDVAQDILLQAWQSITTGHFQPAEGVDREEAFERWLYGVAWRTISHYRGSAWYRRTKLVADPYELAGEPVVPSVEDRIAAREALRVFERLPAWALFVLLYYYAEELDCPTIALIMGSLTNTTNNRLRLARAHFIAALKRWRKP